MNKILEIELEIIKLKALSNDLVKLHNTLEGVREDVEVWMIAMEQSIEDLK